MLSANLFRNLFTRKPSRATFACFLSGLTEACVCTLAALIPLWFLPVTADALDFNKQLLLIVLVCVALIAWFGRGLFLRSLSFTHSWVHLTVLFVFVGHVLASLLSQDRYTSFVGTFGQMQWALVTVTGFILFYFLVAHWARAQAHAGLLLRWFILGSFFVSLFGFLQVFGFGAFFSDRGFNSIGTVSEWGSFLIIPTLLAASLLVLRDRSTALFWNVVFWAMLVMGLVVALVVDQRGVWAGLLFGSALLAFLAVVRRPALRGMTRLLIPAVLVVVSILFLFIARPFALQAPLEVSLSAGDSWRIARQALQVAPIFGSGPGTWAINGTRYRAVEMNDHSLFWQLRFDHGASALFTIIATFGVIGTATILLLLISVFVRAVTFLVRETDEASWQWGATLFIGWGTIVFLSFFVHLTFSHYFAFWLLLGLLSALFVRGEWVWDRIRSPGRMALFTAVFLAIVFAALAALWLMGQRWVADMRYAQANVLLQQQESLDQPLFLLNQAVMLNPFYDAYYRRLSQVHLAAAKTLLARSAEEGTERSFRGQVTAATTRAAQAIQANPSSADNWANAAGLYAALLQMVPDAGTLAFDRYQQAIARDPSNPVLMHGLGGLFFARAQLLAQSLESFDEPTRLQAEQEVQSLLGDAEEWLMRAVALKADYAPALYQLGMVYRAQERLEEAIELLEAATAADPRDASLALQLAALYDQAGEMEKAQSLLEGVVESIPEYADARWMLADLHERAGRLDEAILQIQAIVDLYPESTEAADRLQRLQEAKSGTADSES